MSTMTSPRPSFPIHYGESSAVSSQPLVAWPIQIAFYLFVFSVPFEGYDPWGIRGVMTISKMAAYVFFLVSLFQASVCLKWLPKVLLCFVTFLLVFSFREAFNDINPLGTIHLILMLFQLIAMFWLSANLMERPDVAKRTIITLGLSCGLVGCLMLSGLIASERMGRTSAFTMDENYIGLIYVIGSLILIGLAHGRLVSSKAWSLVAWPITLVLFLQIVATGSRTAMVAMPFGAAMIVFKKGRVVSKLWALLVVSIAVFAFVYVVVGNATAVERWERTVKEKTLSGRESLYPEAFKMFLERPILGWGRTASTWELGRRLGEKGPAGPHNELLSHLVAGGLTQTLPLVIGVLLCLRGAWVARGGSLGSIPLAILMTVLLVGMSIDVYHRKVAWLALALGFACGRSAAREKLEAVSQAIAYPYYPQAGSSR
jgi:O-antigen ligase